jgi:hypothetical protein
MAFTHNTAAVAANNSNTTTSDVSVTGVNSADAVQIVVKWEGGDTTVTVADSGGTDNFTAGEKVVHGNTDLCMQTFYLTSATVTGSVTYRATFASARNYKGLACVVVTPDSGETVTLDDSNSGSGTSTSVSSGNIALSGSDISVLAAYGPYSVANTSSHQINGSATGVTVTSTYTYGIAWYARYTSSFTGAATCTLDSSNDWVCAAVALKSASSTSAAITGTATASITEADIVTGGKTIIITLTGDTFIAAGTGPIGSTANTQSLIDGIDSAQAEAAGWDAVVKVGIETADVVRTSNTVATITLDAEATYNITATETITVTIPAAVLTGAAQIVATPTFTITATAAANTMASSLMMMGMGY